MDVKDFVSFGTAKKLKASRFDEPCITFYIDTEKIPLSEIKPFPKPKNWNECESRYSAPTLWQVQKWLREVKGIDITISAYRVIDETVSPRIIKRFYECEITTEDDEDYIPYSEDEPDFPSYEVALSAGIDTALNLINNKTE